MFSLARYRFAMVVCFLVPLMTLSYGQGTLPTKRKSVEVSGKEAKFSAEVRFRFDILNLVTNHQFEGQTNSFHVSYKYSGLLAGGGFDPKGHKVAKDAFPYFQTVRDDIISYIQSYPDKEDFYELFGTNICKHVLRKYPQIIEIGISIDIPAFAGVAIDRGETVMATRLVSRPGSHR